MLDKTKAIVLSHYKYGDSSLIVHLFTQDLGRRSFLVKAARSKKSKIRASLFQLLSVLHLEFYHKEKQDLLLIKDAVRAITFNSFPFEIKKSSQAVFIAEILHKCLIEQAPDRDLFNFLENSLQYFDLMDSDSANFHLAFLMKLTRYLGILPTFNSNEEIRSLDLLEGGFTPNIPRHFHYIQADNAKILFDLFTKNFDESSLIPLSRNTRNKLLLEILKFYTLNGYKIDNLKSLPVLIELFSE